MPTSNLNLTEETKRWLITGCVLHNVLLPELRKYIEPELLKLYNNLNQYQRLVKQTYGNRLKNDGGGGSYNFNYNSINQNDSKSAAKWNCSVISHHDLAKLYLKPFMAKFSSITDESFDASAGLSILKSCSLFPQDLQDAADIVRRDVRNSWGHCNLSEWDVNKFSDCFQQMKKLVTKMNLSALDEQKLLNETKEWETDGNKCYFIQLAMSLL